MKIEIVVKVHSWFSQTLLSSINKGEEVMSNTIQPVSPAQSAPMVNPNQDKPPQPKPEETPEAVAKERPRAETQEAEGSRARENPAAENQEPQETQNNQADKQSGKTLDIMA